MDQSVLDRGRTTAIALRAISDGASMSTAVPHEHQFSSGMLGRDEWGDDQSRTLAAGRQKDVKRGCLKMFGKRYLRTAGTNPRRSRGTCLRATAPVPDGSLHMPVLLFTKASV